jgi:CHAD domain-containing protein
VTSVWFQLPDTADRHDLLAALADGHELAEQPPRAVRRRHLDSFDWRLHRAGATLVRTDGTWQLRALAAPEIWAEAPAAAGPAPRFAADFPAGTRLQKRLRKLLKMRALLHLITVAGEERRWHLLNADQKTVARLALQTLRLEKPARDQQWRLLRIEPLRGYEEAAASAAAAARSSGLAPLALPLVDTLLRAADLEPESYSSKFRAELVPSQPALSATVVIARTLLQAMRQNEAGLKADIDTEFLHDFRVAIRRTRSALTHFKGVFDPAAVAPFQDDLRSLGRLTGPLRDRDVYLLDEDRYRGLLPADLRDGLDGLFDRLRRERADELRRLRRALDDPAYRDFQVRWEAFLADPVPGPRAALPVADLVRARLRKRHRRVLRDGRAIDDRSPAEDLHALRIECKKLRYLLEFSVTLFPAGEVDTLIRHLKGLQDNLGEFNDLSVQHAWLRGALDAVGGRSRRARLEAAAIGGLITALDAQQARVRAEFAAAFAAFAAKDVRQRFARLTEGPAATQEGSA